MEIEDAATKRPRARGGRRARSAGDDTDRLSALPDSLLHAIMSFEGPAGGADVCASHALAAPLVLCAVPRRRPRRVHLQEWEDFEDFTGSLMHRCNVALLDSLSLRVTRSRAPGFANRHAGGWLRRAMKYCMPESSSSWRLRRLYLCNVALDTRFEKHVRSVCCSLEDLDLEDCTSAFQALTSRSLKNLVLKNCMCSLSEITLPSLKSLVIAGGSNNVHCVVVAPAIAHLCLDVPLCFARSISVNQTSSLPRL